MEIKIEIKIENEMNVEIKNEVKIEIEINIEIKIETEVKCSKKLLLIDQSMTNGKKLNLRAKTNTYCQVRAIKYGDRVDLCSVQPLRCYV